MKRTDITELFPEATKEQIDKLLGINGNDINGAKGEAENLRTQLATANASLQKYQGTKDQETQLQEAQNTVATLQTELEGLKQKDTIRTMREKVASDKAIPASLLTGDTEDACVAQADAILAFAKTNSGYPQVKDGGEVGKFSASSNREKFAEWAENNF